MKKRKKLFIVLAVLILTALYIMRFRQLNQKFPKETVQVIEAGQSVIYENIEYKVISGELMSEQNYRETYQIEEESKNDGKVMVVWLEVENQTDTEQHMKVADMVATYGVWANGIDYFTLWNINGQDFDGMLQGKEKKKVGVAANVNTDFEKLMKTKSEWNIRLAGWPNRIEMVVPIKS